MQPQARRAESARSLPGVRGEDFVMDLVELAVTCACRSVHVEQMRLTVINGLAISFDMS